MQHHTVGLVHHEPIRAHRDKRTKLPNSTFYIDTKDHHIRQTAVGVAQGILNRSRPADLDDLGSDGAQGAGNRWLAYLYSFSQLARSQRSAR